MREGGEGEVSHILSENINLDQFLSSTDSIKDRSEKILSSSHESNLCRKWTVKI